MPSEPLSSAEALRQLRDWIVARAKNLPPGGLTDELPLFTGRHLTSLHVPELILLLERLRKAPVDVEELSADDFRDVRTIAERFLGVRPDDAVGAKTGDAAS